jgi:hypothetical protein
LTLALTDANLGSLDARCAQASEEAMTKDKRSFHIHRVHAAARDASLASVAVRKLA